MIKRFLYNFYFFQKKIGLIQTINFFLRKLFKVNKNLKIIFKNKEYYIRTREHDLEVLLSNLDKEFEFLKNINLSEDQFIIDAGAYIGASSIRFSQLFNNNKIIAIEPFKENYDILVKNIQAYENIIPINSALVSSNYNEEVLLYKSKTGAWGNNILKNTLDNRNLDVINKVNKIDLNILLNTYKKKIGILKLDIEGSEKMIFQNEKNILKEIDIIIVELHSKIDYDIDKIFFSFSNNRYNFSFDSEKIVSIKKK
ncbi:fkbM_fam, methyltransferase, FkbM family [Candidatus Pelagibacterales bacterium]